MNSDLSAALDFVQGPVFRFAFALMVLGFLRHALLSGTEIAAAFLMASDRKTVWAKIGQRVLWFFFPHVLLGPVIRARAGWTLYHAVLSMFSFVFRLGALIIPAFMVAHVYLWERALGISWPALPPETADLISFVTIAAGLLVFLGRLYSSALRKIEPTWAFLRPLILIAPFVTGVLAMHPTWSPFGYQTVLLLHVLSACLVFVLLPFARLLSFLATPITKILPQTAWRPVETAEPAVIADSPAPEMVTV